MMELPSYINRVEKYTMRHTWKIDVCARKILEVDSRIAQLSVSRLDIHKHDAAGRPEMMSR